MNTTNATAPALCQSQYYVANINEYAGEGHIKHVILMNTTEPVTKLQSIVEEYIEDEEISGGEAVFNAGQCSPISEECFHQMKPFLTSY